jgi:hypothetical protein
MAAQDFGILRAHLLLEADELQVRHIEERPQAPKGASKGGQARWRPRHALAHFNAARRSLTIGKQAW